MGTSKAFLLNLTTNEEVIIQFRIADKDLTPHIGLNESETLKLIELFRENIAVVESAKPNVPLTASEVTTPLTLENIPTYYLQVSDEYSAVWGWISLQTKMPPERSLSVNNFIAKVKDLQQQGITERVTQPT